MTMAWYPHFMSDYESDTTHLSLMEHGAYRLLLDHYYKKRQPLPANASLLHRVCRAFASEEQAAVRAVLDEFFELRDDGYHQKRADKEISKANEISAKRSHAALIRHKGNNNLEEIPADGNGAVSSDQLHANAVQMHSTSKAQKHASAMHVDTQLTTHIKKEKDPADAGKSHFEKFKDLVEFKTRGNDNGASFLGKMLGDYPRQEVEDAVILAVANDPEDPRAYVRSILNGSARKFISQAEMNSASRKKLVL